MSDFTPLSDVEKKHLRRLLRYEKKRRHQQLMQTGLQSTTRLIHRIKDSREPKTPTQWQWFAKLSEHEAQAFKGLIHRPGAIRYCEAHMELAIRQLKLKETAP